MLKSLFYAFVLLIAPLMADTPAAKPGKETPAPAHPAAPAPAHTTTPEPAPAPAKAPETTDFTHPETEPLAPEVMMQGYEGAFLKMFLTLIALVVAIFFTVWALKRLARGRVHNMNANRTIKIIERRPLSQKTVLYLIEVDGKQALIAESQLEVKRLLTFEDFNQPLDKSSID